MAKQPVVDPSSVRVLAEYRGVPEVRMYRIGDPAVSGREAGHYGATFYIKFDDGRLVESSNLWHVGNADPNKISANAVFLGRSEFMKLRDPDWQPPERSPGLGAAIPYFEKGQPVVPPLPIKTKGQAIQELIRRNKAHLAMVHRAARIAEERGQTITPAPEIKPER